MNSEGHHAGPMHSRDRGRKHSQNRPFGSSCKIIPFNFFSRGIVVYRFSTLHVRNMSSEEPLVRTSCSGKEWRKQEALDIETCEWLGWKSLCDLFRKKISQACDESPAIAKAFAIRKMVEESLEDAIKMRHSVQKWSTPWLKYLH